ncbi:MAG: MFS transporter [Velocimicrobium sp.]
MNIRRMERELNVKFSLIQSFYWMAFCSSMGFGSVFLLSNDFSNLEVGVVLAAANVFAVILQPIIASVADDSKHITLKQLLCILASIATVFSAMLIVVQKGVSILAVLFVVLLTSIIILQPLISGFTFEFINQGVLINFGVTRGAGSVSYAFFSIIIGILLVRFGTNILPYTSFFMLCGVLIMFVLIKDSRTCFKSKKEDICNEETKQPIDKIKKESLLDFARTYKKFPGYLFGIVLIFTCHTMFNNYLIHIVTRIGGTSKSMGIAIFIAAVLELPTMAVFARVLKKTGIRKLLCFSAVFFIIKAVGVLGATNIGLLYINQILQVPSYAIMIPASVYYVNFLMREKDRVKGQAYTTSAITVGAVIGNLIGGTLIDLYGVSAMLIACVLFTIAGFFFILIFTESEGGFGDEKA